MTLLLTNVPATHPVFEGSPLGSRRWDDGRWLHRAVMALFGDLPDAGPRASANILFRVEPEQPGPDGTAGRVLVQSTIAPAADGTATIDLSPLFARLAPGDPVRLHVRANTARTINRTVDGKVKRRREPVPADHLIDWFVGRLDGAAVPVEVGITTADGAASAAAVSAITSSQRMNGHRIVATDFTTTCTVVDPDRLKALCQSGIGKARSYGYGLISVAPHS